MRTLKWGKGGSKLSELLASMLMYAEGEPIRVSIKDSRGKKTPLKRKTKETMQMHLKLQQ